MKQSSLIKNIDTKYNELSKGQKLLADYICNNYEKAVFLTAAKLGKEVGVSESTVVRFAVILGYDGYPALQNALEELVKNKLNSVQRMEVGFLRIDKNNILKSVLQSDAEKIRMTIDDIDENAFKSAVKMILSAKCIYIIGVRSSAILANFLFMNFNIIFNNVKLISSSSASELFEQLYMIKKEDVIVGISFPRYSKNTIKAMEFAKTKDAQIITITDSYNSPMTEYSKCNIIAKCETVSIVDSLVTPLSVINSLIVAICVEKKEDVLQKYNSLEEIWEKYELYNNDETGR